VCTENFIRVDDAPGRHGFKAISAYIALISPRLFTQKATALQADDIYLIPYPESATLDLSVNEQILIDDIVDYQRDLIRLGDSAEAMIEDGQRACTAYSPHLRW
jgi:hypothetical protein